MKGWRFLFILFVISCTADNEGVIKPLEDEPDIFVEETVAKKGDNFAVVFRCKGLDENTKANIIRKLDDTAKVLNIGDTLRCVYINDTLSRVELRKRSGVFYYDISSDGITFVERFKHYYPKAEVIEIEDNLWSTFLERKIPLSVFVEVANIFAWDIDFSTETHRGDTLKILYTDAGNVYYAEYVGRAVGKKVAVRFRGEYYDDKGNTLRRMFLRSPLKSYFITSGFGIRFHPILKKYRAHHGVDYAAPYGFPVYSVADGRVVYAGWMGGYGKVVIVKHGNGFETRYAHLSKILVGRGYHVMQGQTVGLVGSTGLSTGPHLHFEVRKNGEIINPLTIKSKPQKPLPEDMKPEFFTLLNEYRRLMDERIVSR